MSKYDGSKILRETSSRSPKKCGICRSIINAGEVHLVEKLKDKRINFRGKRFCVGCYKKFGKSLLK